ncbi:ATP-grasp fold amidoligase family protein [Roseicyclus sp. F158]|uniref:ATP-grasp fold amidoligase family protein n=1 Tax=Tropicimonas omnivorans TaxID=3075590 RepID=A0ABU3DGC8_9RHOB|nr:ATP-grasp fold amidoligase family protein [Roseicyclus sp. F158]MDT0682778.1 ATP-grasp fold amidoligase family protein [Roseicyclus sp. F158]
MLIPPRPILANRRLYRQHGRLVRKFKEDLGYAPNLARPRTFSEKVQWRKLNDRNPLFRTLADKVAVRDWAADRIGGEEGRALLTECVAVIENAADADVHALPDGVALKSAHASSWNMLVERWTPELRRLAETKLASWTTGYYGAAKSEAAYLEVPRRVLVDRLLYRADGKLADVLKILCFHGRAEALCINQWPDGAAPLDGDGEFYQSFMTPEWAPAGFTTGRPTAPVRPPRPKRLGDALSIAERLSAGIDFVRVDLLATEDELKLSEMTLYPKSGLVPYDPPRWDRLHGDLWTLPQESRSS